MSGLASSLMHMASDGADTLLGVYPALSLSGSISRLKCWRNQ